MITKLTRNGGNNTLHCHLRPPAAMAFLHHVHFVIICFYPVFAIHLSPTSGMKIAKSSRCSFSELRLRGPNVTWHWNIIDAYQVRLKFHIHCCNLKRRLRAIEIKIVDFFIPCKGKARRNVWVNFSSRAKVQISFSGPSASSDVKIKKEKESTTAKFKALDYGQVA